MKKNIIKCATMALMLMCGASANAQIDLGNILGCITGNSNSTTSNVISGLTSIFSSDKQATADNIVGTWTYDSPAIVFESDDLLSKAGAAIAAKKIETKLQTTLTKYGITKDKFSITFKNDGTFSETIKGKTYSGKWTVKDSKLQLTYAYKTMDITTQKEGNKLMFVTDATKLLTLVQSLGAKTATSSSLSTITSLAKNIKGMKVGLTLVKN
ncbi:MAG: lipocalin-like domain-containing protein [Prevotella sp.]